MGSFFFPIVWIWSTFPRLSLEENALKPGGQQEEVQITQRLWHPECKDICCLTLLLIQGVKIFWWVWCEIYVIWVFWWRNTVEHFLCLLWDFALCWISGTYHYRHWLEFCHFFGHTICELHSYVCEGFYNMNTYLWIIYCTNGVL